MTLKGSFLFLEDNMDNKNLGFTTACMRFFGKKEGQSLTDFAKEIKDIPISQIIKAHYHDKKFIGYTNRFILIKHIGKAQRIENIPLKIIKAVLQQRI
jgi:3-dehydroquinate synthetase